MKHFKVQNKRAYEALKKGDKKPFLEYFELFKKENDCEEIHIVWDFGPVPYFGDEEGWCHSIHKCQKCSLWFDVVYGEFCSQSFADFDTCQDCFLFESATEENKEKLRKIKKDFRPKLTAYALNNPHGHRTKRKIKKKINRRKP